MNQRNNIEDEIDSSNEDEEINDIFMNKKELVHIENDTSINVDKSFEDDKSRSNTLKKDFIINNISAINERLSEGVDLNEKKVNDNTSNIFSKYIKGEESIDLNGTQKKLNATPITNYRNIEINPNNYFEDINHKIIEEEINTMNNYLNMRKKVINNYNDNYSITSFTHNFIGLELNLQNIDFQNGTNEYNSNQLDSKLYLLNEHYKKLKKEYQELNDSNKSVLELLSYWQKFYLEIKEIVFPGNANINNNSEISMSMNDYMDDQYRAKVIEEVKKIIKISRDKVYNNFYKTPIVNFSFINKIKNNIINLNKWNCLYQNKEDSFFIKKTNLDEIIDNSNNIKLSKKFLDESYDLDFLPPFKYPEKINAGTNTDNKPNNIFPSEKLSISKNIAKQTFFEIKSSKNINSNNLRVKKLVSCPSNKNINIKSRQKNYEIISTNKIMYEGKSSNTNSLINSNSSSSIPIKFKKNVTYKIAKIQTDITKDSMSQLLLSQKEKEKIKNQYEEKIMTLNNYIKNNIEKNKNKNNMSTSNSSKMFLPEMIPPELTYKIFMNCIKNFKYEEGIYKKYIKEDDLYIMKSFVEKMEKYIMVTSLPILKASKRKDYIVHTKANNESSAQKKYKENILTSNKHMFMNKNMNANNQKKRNISETKFDDRSNSMVGNNMNYNKYKASLLSQKEN